MNDGPALSGTSLRLTPAAPNTGYAAAWYKPKVDVSAGFLATFTFDLGSPSQTGADGLAFSLQNVWHQMVGDETGFEGQILGISIDTYPTSTVSLFAGTTVLTTVPLPGALPGTGEHTVTVESDGLNVTVTVDRILEISTSFDLLGALPEDGMVWVGFTARTGAEYQSHDITRFRFQKCPSTAECESGLSSVASGDGSVWDMRVQVPRYGLSTNDLWTEPGCVANGVDLAVGLGSDRVCGATPPSCLIADAATAAQACADVGMRLCTLGELVRDEAAGSDCGFDTEATWSSTPCEDGFWGTAGASAGSGSISTACWPSDVERATRCCIDAARGWSVR